MPDYFWLTPDDRRFLDELRQERNKRLGARPVGFESDDTPPGRNRVYVAKTPTDGIPALIEGDGGEETDEPGVAECRIFELIRDFPEQIPHFKEIPDGLHDVYNLSTEALASNRWIPIVCDEFGRWYAVPVASLTEEIIDTGTGTGTGTNPEEPVDTGTGTNPDNVLLPCEPVCIDEVDVFCEAGSATLSTELTDTGSGTGTSATLTTLIAGRGAGTWDVDVDVVGTGTGTGTSQGEVGIFTVEDSGGFTITATPKIGGWTVNVDGGGLGTGQWRATITSEPSGGTPSPSITTVEEQYYLNLYRRKVCLNFSDLTGCLVKEPQSWQYVRTIGCCTPDCAEPDTGTGTNSLTAATCCSDGTLYDDLDFTINGPTLDSCGSCVLTGVLTRNGLLRIYNTTSSTTCGGQAFAELTLYCSGESWRLSGVIRGASGLIRVGPFDEAATVIGFDSSLLEINVNVPGCSNDLLIWVTNPCYHWECVAGACVQRFGEITDPETQWLTEFECLPNCAVEEPIETECCEVPVPSILIVTVTNKTGECTCMPDSFTIYWDGTQWIPGAGIPAPAFFPGCAGMGAAGGAGDYYGRLLCDGGTWTYGNATAEDSQVADSVTCEPALELVFNNLQCTVCEHCIGTYTLTITEP